MAAPLRRRYYFTKCISYGIPFVTILLGWLLMDKILIFLSFDTTSNGSRGNGKRDAALSMDDFDVIRLDPTSINVSIRDPNCTYWRCFDPYRCNHYGDYRLTVYIYPWRKYVRIGNESVSMAPEPSREFVELLDAVRRSPYYEPDPKKACLFLPSIDTLNEERLNAADVSAVLASLKW